jgi:hypothetical protein
MSARAESVSTSEPGDYGQALGAVWPEVGERIRRTLVRRGVPQQMTEDFAQEAAAEALCHEVPFSTPDELFAWTYVVAKNRAVDAHRRDWRLVDAEVPPIVSAGDLGDQVVLRLALQSLQNAVSELPPAELAALSATVRGEPVPSERRSAVRLAVARFRARQRLLAVVEGLLGLLVWAWRRMRRTAGSAGTPLAVALALVALLTPPGMALNRSRSSQKPPSRRPALSGLLRGPSTPGRSKESPPAITDGDPRPKPVPAPVVTIPYRTVIIPSPLGGAASLATRPETAADHFLCFGPLVTGYRCLDYPAPLSSPNPIFSSP